MAHLAIVAQLRRVALFQGLQPLQVTEIARYGEKVVYRPGDVIIQEDEIGDAAVLIVSGDAERVSGPDLGGVPHIVPSGALLGEMAMLIETEHSSTIVARTEVRALRICRDRMIAQMAEDPELADHLVERISSRLGDLISELRRIDGILAGPSGSQSTSLVPTHVSGGHGATH